jgi:polysaccharide pyruvyl transferase WcaK-like protein
VRPDLACGLDSGALRRQIERSSAGERPVVGINPMVMYHPLYWFRPDEGRYRHYVRHLASFCLRLFREGYPFFFFTTQVSDEQVFADVLEILRAEAGGEWKPDGMLRQGRTVQELMELYAAADMVVVTRFHGTVLGLVAERPTLAICYYRKARELMMTMGQGDYAVELDALDSEELWRRFEALERNRLLEREKIHRHVLEQRQALNRQYEHVFGQLAARRDPPVLESVYQKG